MSNTLRIVFMGTPDFAAVALEALAKSEHQVVMVVSQPDAQRNRGKKVLPTPVKEMAMKYELPVMQPERISKEPEALEQLRKLNADLFVVAAYGQILSKEVLDMPRLGCINIHGSLLPKYRGAAPIQRVILDGQEQTGITIMQMAEGLDTGDMISSVATPVARKNFEQLHDELAELGAKLLIDTLPSIADGTAVRTPQKDEDSCYAAKILKEEGELDFSKDAVSLERVVRGYYGAYTYLEGEVFKVWAADVLSGGKGQPGQVVSTEKDGIVVATGEGNLKLTLVQAAGKKKMPAGDFLRGRQLAEGTVFGR